MAVNRDKPNLWKMDIAKSVDMYNNWFMKFAPKAFRETRVQTTKDVERTLRLTDNLTNVQPAMIRKNPEILPTLRMSTCPPLAVDRLIGLSGVSVKLEGGVQNVNIPIDAMIHPKSAQKRDFPIFFETKSAGDFTNTNKRRKEEAAKMAQLRNTYGKSVRFNLFLCGYFDSGYLGYEAAEGLDWVWEHRMDDLAKFGI